MSASSTTGPTRAEAAATASSEPLPNGWRALTTLVMWVTFLQAVTAGRMLSGDGWARDAHRATAGVLVATTLVAGVVALATLRQPRGRRMGTLLVVLTVGLVVQYALGTAAADGEDVLWIHIPVGVGLIGLMDQARMVASGKVNL